MFKGCKRRYLAGKWRDSIVNFRQYFNLKVGVFGQVGGRVWAGRRACLGRKPVQRKKRHSVNLELEWKSANDDIRHHNAACGC